MADLTALQTALKTFADQASPELAAAKDSQTAKAADLEDMLARLDPPPLHSYTHTIGSFSNKRRRPMQSLMAGCRWVDAPSEDGHGSIERWNLQALVGFPLQRIFWLTDLDQDQWRGRHAHRESTLATFAVTGGCQMTLDNGAYRQTVQLRQGGQGLVVGPWIWHDLFDFLPTTVILVGASTLYDEAEYIRDYNTFLRESQERRSATT